MQYTKEYLQNLCNSEVRRKDSQAIEKIISQIEKEVLSAAKLGKEYYEWRNFTMIPRIRSEIYNQLVTKFVGCKVTHTEVGFYVSWI